MRTTGGESGRGASEARVERVARAERIGRGTPRIRGNDYSVLDPPPLGGWDPVLDVSVVVPASGSQEELDLVLASLAAQSYPRSLTEVVVVDGRGAVGDGSEPALRLPEIRPENTRVLVVPPGGRGPVQAGVDASEGAVVLCLDADMVVDRVHVEAQMRWHHLADYLVLMGGVRYATRPVGELTPAGLRDRVRRGEPAFGPEPEVAGAGPGRGPAPAEGTGADAGHRAWEAFTGSACSVRRELVQASGGPDLDGSDPGGPDPGPDLAGGTRLGYRLAQRGAVFVPEPAAVGWRPSVSRTGGRKREDTRFSASFLDNRVPYRPTRRASCRRLWQVPFVDVVVEVSGSVFEEVSDTVGRLLGGDTADVRMTLVGEWSRVSSGRHAALDDPATNLRLVRECFRCESRVRFADRVPDTDPDVPFRLSLPPGLPLRAGAVRTLTAAADGHGAGIVRVGGSGGGGPCTMRLERTAAFARARRLGPVGTAERAGAAGAAGAAGLSGAAGAELDAVVAELWGEYRLERSEVLAEGRSEDGEPPADWHKRMCRAERSAARDRAAAERWERRIRVLVRGRHVRLLLGRQI